MNTVLDDNKKLCLMSGEIIALTDTMSLIFEVMDLAAASPATVSRCGMIYMNPASLGWRTLATSWLESLSIDLKYRDIIKKWLEIYVDDLLLFLRSEGKEISTTSDSGLFKSFSNYFEASLPSSENEQAESDTEKYILKMEYRFIFSIIWSIGGVLDFESRVKFSERISKLIRKHNPKVEFPEHYGAFDVVFNEDYQRVGQHSEVFKGESSWIVWDQTLENKEIPKNAQFNEIMIPSKVSSRVNFLMDLLILKRKPFLLVGPTGTGKSKYVTRKLISEVKNDMVSIFVSFSPRTTANQAQDLIMSKMEKRRKGVYGPNGGKKGSTNINVRDYIC
jgi:dynein heavy chain